MQILRPIFALLALLGISFQHALSQCVTEEQQIDTYLYSSENFGQSFQACNDGYLHRLEFPVHHFLTGTITADLDVFEGDGYAGEILYSNTVVLIDEWGASVDHILSEEVVLHNQSSYTFRLSFNGEYGVMWGNFTDGYPEGMLYWNDEEQATIDMGFTATLTPLLEEPCRLWTGVASSDWNDPENWLSGQIPDSTTCVEIPALIEGSYPTITEIAYAAALSIAEGAEFSLNHDATLQVHGHLNSYGSTAYDGKVILVSGNGDSEINGSPIFNELIINGVFFTSEAIEILNVLDLTQGYLANFGTEVILNSGAGFNGHAYMPNEVIVGHVIIKRHLDEFGEQIIGTPFLNLDVESMMETNDIDDINTFDHQFGIGSFESNWTSNQDFQPEGPCDALRVNSGQSTIVIEGETSNDDMIVEGSTSAISPAGQLQLVANPYPSVIDIDELIMTPGASSAAYVWLPEKQQFGSRNGEMSTHDMGDRLLPSEAVMVQLNETEQLKFIYSLTSLEPWELEQAQATNSLSEHQIKLGIRSDLGFDELLIRFNEAAEISLDPDYDALKIPSLSELVPTLGSVSATGEVLSINAIPHPPVGTSIPLYTKAGIDGLVTIEPNLIDIAEQYDRVLLHDRALGIYHNLIAGGNYQYEASTTDSENRFKLILGTEAQNPLDSSPLIDLLEEADSSAPITDVVNTEEVNEQWNISAFLNEIVVEPIDLESSAAQKRIKVHTLEGKLVFDRLVELSSTGWTYPLHVSSGVYVVTVSHGDQEQSEKLWID